MSNTITVPEKVLQRLISYDDNVKEWEGWEADADTSKGSFDSEKGSMYDYPIVLTSSEGKVYKTEAGYYNGPAGHCFNEPVEFTEFIKKKRKPAIKKTYEVGQIVKLGGKSFKLAKV